MMYNNDSSFGARLQHLRPKLDTLKAFIHFQMKKMPDPATIKIGYTNNLLKYSVPWKKLQGTFGFFYRLTLVNLLTNQTYTRKSYNFNLIIACYNNPDQPNILADYISINSLLVKLTIRSNHPACQAYP